MSVKWRERILPAVLIMSSIFVCMLLLEISIRVYKGRLTDTENILLEQLELLKAAYPWEYDGLLGWIPSPGSSGNMNAWGTEVTILNDGIRSNGKNRPLEFSDDKVILAVGDSFTFGDEVSDSETWPAILEELLGMRVINAGVFGYGLDQTLLRAEVLLPEYRPDILIVSFIPEDIDRCQLSMKISLPKPYYTIVNGELELNNQPVPTTMEETRDLNVIRKVFGHSYFMNEIMRRIDREYWFTGVWGKKYVHKRGSDVACLLMGKLSEIAHTYDIRVIVLAQYLEKETGRQRDIDAVRHILNCIDKRSMEVLDLLPYLTKIRSEEPVKFEAFFHSHMTKEGNTFVAQRLRDHILFGDLRE